MTTTHPAAVSAARSRALEHFRRGSADMDADIAIIHRHYAPVLEEKDRRIAELEAQLAQEKVWKEEDPRMLREQCRVSDVAFQHLHCQVHGQPLPDWANKFITDRERQAQIRALEWAALAMVESTWHHEGKFAHQIEQLQAGGPLL